DADDPPRRLASEPAPELAVEPIALELLGVVGDRSDVAGDEQEVARGHTLGKLSVHIAHGDDLHPRSPGKKCVRNRCGHYILWQCSGSGPLLRSGAKRGIAM